MTRVASRLLCLPHALHLNAARGEGGNPLIANNGNDDRNVCRRITLMLLRLSNSYSPYASTDGPVMSVTLVLLNRNWEVEVAVNANSGGSFCITQKWIHDHPTIRAQKKVLSHSLSCNRARIQRGGVKSPPPSFRKTKSGEGPI